MNKSTMTEHPILFSAEMVRAIRERRKTQTRRVIRNPERLDGLMLHGEAAEWCPYGQPGDTLWVREAWRTWSWHEGEPVNIVFRDGVVFEPNDEQDSIDFEQWEERMIDQSAEDCYRAGWIIPDGEDEFWHPDPGHEDDPAPTRWRPSIHMPRWASRITLEIVGVRIERVQEISESDAIAEGAPYADNPDYDAADPCYDREQTATAEFIHLWDSINAKRGYGWDTNPWVWVVEFQPRRPGAAEFNGRATPGAEG